MTQFTRYLHSKRDDILLFIASLGISLILFLQLQSALVPDKEREFDVPLSFGNQPEDVTVLQAPRTVKVLASGSQSVIDSLETSRVHATVDLTNAQPGRGRYRIEVTGPFRPGLTLSPVRALEQMSVEKKLHVRHPVELHPVGTPPENYTFEGAVVSPVSVDASGPESIVRDVVKVRAILDLSLIAPNKPIDVELEALDAAGRPVPLITFDPPKVMLSTAVSIGLSRRKLLVTPVFLGQPPFGYRVTGYSVVPNQVETTGESADLSRLTTVDTEPIDLSGMRSSTTLTVGLQLPNGLTTKSGGEVQVNVTVRRN